MKAKTLTPAQQFKLDIENVRLKHASKHTDQKYKVAMKELVSLERHDAFQPTASHGLV